MNDFFLKKVKNQNLWNFELGSQKSMIVPIFTFSRFQQRDGQDSQNLNIDVFFKLPVTNAQCVIGMEKYSDAGIILFHDDDDFCQGYGQIKEDL